MDMKMKLNHDTEKKPIREQNGLLFETLTHYSGVSTAWVERKETAAWAATALYIAGLLYASGGVNSWRNEIWSLRIIMLLSIPMWLAFLSFIYAQYGSVYSGLAYRTAAIRFKFLI